MKPEEAPSCREQRAPIPGFDSSPIPGFLCAGCGSGIRDRFLLRVCGSSWHERCLRCSRCSRGLSGSCFSRERRLYCRPDYEKLFLQRCSRCQGPVGRSERIQRVLERIFHERCLRCRRCRRRLRSGDRFVLRDGQILCHREFLALARSEDGDDSQPQSRPQSRSRSCGKDPDGIGKDPDGIGIRNDPEGIEKDLDGIGNDPDGVRNDLDGVGIGKDPKRSKRPRTILSSQQRRAFKASFEVSPKPCRKVRESLAAQTGLTVRVVQVWFQNQRAKMKKLARRQQQQQEKEQEKFGNSGAGILEGAGAGRSSQNGEELRGLDGSPAPFSRIPGNFGILEPNGFGTELQPHDPKGVFQDLAEAPIPTDAQIPGIPKIPRIPGNPMELLYPGNPKILGIPGITEIPGNPMELLFSMQSSYFTS